MVKRNCSVIKLFCTCIVQKKWEPETIPIRIFLAKIKNTVVSGNTPTTNTKFSKKKWCGGKKKIKPSHIKKSISCVNTNK